MPADHEQRHESGDEADITAAELALGVLDGAERAQALRRVIAEPDFAREVEKWRGHFGTMFADWPEVTAPDHLLGRIEQSLEPGRRSVGYWPAVAAMLTLVAASLLLVIVLFWMVSVPTDEVQARPPPSSEDLLPESVLLRTFNPPGPAVPFTPIAPPVSPAI